MNDKFLSRPLSNDCQIVKGIPIISNETENNVRICEDVGNNVRICEDMDRKPKSDPIIGEVNDIHHAVDPDLNDPWMICVHDLEKEICSQCSTHEEFILGEELSKIFGLCEP